MLPYLLILLAFAADRLTKWWVAANMSTYGVVQIGPFFSFNPVYNRGIAFGFLQGIGPIVGWLSIGVVIGLFIYMVRAPRSMSLLRVGLALIIGGAMGNLIDRVTVGYVLDFLQTPLRSSIINVADVMINTGMVISLIGVIFQHPEEPEKVVEQPGSE